MPTCRSCLPRACHFSMAHVTAPSGVAAGVGVASRAPRVGGRARAYAVTSRGSVGARRVSLSPSSRGCDFAGSARDLAASTSRERARGTRVRAVQIRAVQGTSFPPPSSTRGGPPLGGLPNPRPISASPVSQPTSFLPPTQAVGMPSPNETTAADAAVSSVGSLASSQTRRRPFHSFDGPPTVSSTIEPGSPSPWTPSSSPSP